MFTFLVSLIAAAAIVVGVAPLRRRLLSDPMLGWFRKVLPQVSQTEQEALDAGTVWWDGELFSGRPDWKRLLAYPKPTLTAEEQAFLDGPVEQLCAMLDDWQVSHELNDLPPVGSAPAEIPTRKKFVGTGQFGFGSNSAEDANHRCTVGSNTTRGSLTSQLFRTVMPAQYMSPLTA